MFRSFRISLLASLLLSLSACLWGAEGAGDPARTTLETARSLGEGHPKEGIELLKKGLSRAGALEPWYLTELARLSGLSGDWQSAREWGSRAAALPATPALADTLAWWYGLALEKTGERASAVKVYRARIDSKSSSEPLLWLACLRTADSGAETVSDSLDASFPLLKLTDPDSYALSRYLAGLCAVRSGEWSFAVRSLERFDAVRGGRFPELAPWSAYYTAWSLNRSGRTPEALAAFSSYLRQWPYHERVWQAATSAALAASQNPGSGSDPVALADRAVSSAPTRDDRADSLILRSTLLLDRGDRAAAERDLPGIVDGSLTGGPTPQASRAQFLYADIAFRFNDFTSAVARWERLMELFPREPLAEESLYRIGDARYIAGDWKAAGEAFSRYRLAWPSGRFLAAALRSGGEAWFRSGNTDLAILWWEDLLKKFPDSSSVPGTLRDLSEAYRVRRDYAAALRVASSYRERFPNEAALDGMDGTVAELTDLAAPTAKSGSAKLSAYKSAGGALSPEGRALGLSLAREWLTDWNRRSEALSILSEIASKTPKSPEGLTLSDRRNRAAVMMVLANEYRADGRHAEAAALFLSSGTWYAALDPERAAESLYGAVDSFLQAGRTGDSAKTLETLRKTWPESVWTRRALIAAGR